MKCSDVFSLLVDFLYQEMPAAERREFLAHVDGCTACSAEVKAMSSTLGHARAALRGPLSEDPPARVRTRVLEAAQAALAAKSAKPRATRAPEPEGFFARLWKTPWLVPALGAAGVATAVFLVKVIKNPQVLPEQKPAVTEALTQPAAKPQELKQAQAHPEREPTAAPTAPAPAERGLAGLARKPTARSDEAPYVEMRHAKKTGSGGLRPAARTLDNLGTVGRRSYDDDLLDQVEAPRARVPVGEATASKGGGKAIAPSKSAAETIAKRAPAPAMHASKDEARLDDLLRPLPKEEKAPVSGGAGSSGRWAQPPPPRAPEALVAAAPAPVASAAAPASARPARAEEAQAKADSEDRPASPVAEEPARSASPAKMRAPVRAAPAGPAAQTEAPADKKKAAERKEAISFEERVRKAEKLFAEKKWAEAAAAFRALLAQAPSNPAAKTWRERLAAADLAQEQARAAKAKKAATSNDALDGL
jgi:ribonuclease E